MITIYKNVWTVLLLSDHSLITFLLSQSLPTSISVSLVVLLVSKSFTPAQNPQEGVVYISNKFTLSLYFKHLMQNHCNKTYIQ